MAPYSEAHLGLFGGEKTLEQEFRHHNIRTIALTVRGWAGGTCASFPDFCDYHQFHVIFTVFTLANVLYFKDFMIHDHVDS